MASTERKEMSARCLCESCSKHHLNYILCYLNICQSAVWRYTVVWLTWLILAFKWNGYKWIIMYLSNICRAILIIIIINTIRSKFRWGTIHHLYTLWWVLGVYCCVFYFMLKSAFVVKKKWINWQRRLTTMHANCHTVTML